MEWVLTWEGRGTQKKTCLISENVPYWKEESQIFNFRIDRLIRVLGDNIS